MKLSFIVPIYNVKAYLQKCVNSLVSQDFDDYEIILVDDGSTDGSGELADAIAYGNPSLISVIHQENQGLSGARNKGVDASKGEYLCFVDSDDYWEKNVLRGLMEQIERDNLDVLRFNWQNVRESGESFYPYKEKNLRNVFSSTVVDGLTFLNERMSDQCYACMFILKRHLFNFERFTDGILFEDTDWTPRILLRANRVAGADTIVYNYLWRENGITLGRSKEKVRKELDNKLQLISKLKMWNKGVWFDEMIASLIVSIVEILSGSMWNERKVFIKHIKELDVLPMRYGRARSRKAKKVMLINLDVSLTILLLHIKNR